MLFRNNLREEFGGRTKGGGCAGGLGLEGTKIARGGAEPDGIGFHGGHYSGKENGCNGKWKCGKATAMDGTARKMWAIGAGLALIVVVNAALAVVMKRYVTDRVLAREGEVARDFLNSIVAADAATLFATPAPSPALQNFSATVRRLPGMIRINIYAPDRFIRYSNNAGLIGIRFEDNAELDESLKGALIAKLEQISSDIKDEHIALRRSSEEEILEAYIPVNDAAGKIVAVVEFYRSGAGIQAFIADVMRLIWVSLGLGVAVMCLALYAAFTGLFRRKP